MKIKTLFAILFAVILLICACIVPTNAKTNENNNDIEIIIYDEVSEETKEKIERYFANGEPAEDDGITTYGLTCTLLGHKIQSTIVGTVNHKVRSTSPRCLEKTYEYEACTRCDYETSTLIDSEYIICCS